MGEARSPVEGDSGADVESRIAWLKIADPEAEVPDFPIGTDVRVMVPADVRFRVLREKLAANGISVHEVPYLLEDEIVSGYPLTATATECRLTRSTPREFPAVAGADAVAARDAFDELWDIHSSPEGTNSEHVPASGVVPQEWLRFLPYSTLNPAQAAAMPHILGNLQNMLVVAPTGAGKSVIGMAAALRTVLQQGRKAAWLVPQRSLTDELDRELEAWRRAGLRVERLSGEYSVDAQRVRQADLWIATTEKFEAMCRASSLREALAEVGCLIVDEIHLLGDTERGPVLEALLARMRGGDSGMRIIGLSATVSNAGQIAKWLDARLLHVSWRPSRLTWQLPTIAAHADWGIMESARTRLASAITTMITRDQGSVLVFCGSKRNVRRTALIIAGARGADTTGVHPDQEERLYQVCRQAGVGLHYKGWEHKHEAEIDFRARKLNVLVATSTVAAGVNLPARAVVVQDTDVGLSRIDVATVQQMFGRAGRVGAGESQGWAFLLVTERERAAWQAKLVAGHTVASQIQSSLSDHVLAEAVQRRIGSLAQAEEWWAGTLAYHQGNRSHTSLHRAVESLLEERFLIETDSDGFVPSELGKLTARLMVPAKVGADLRRALAHAELPDDAESAEEILIDIVSTVVPKLAHTAINEDLKVVVNRLLRPSDDTANYEPGDLARTALMLVANSPESFRRGARIIAGVPYPALYPILEEAPRYLHWIGCQGMLGSVHPWAAIVAADLSKRVRWRRCQPARGAGRLLWMCEQMATPAHTEDLVPALWQAATAKGITQPDWSGTGRPRQCRLDEEAYLSLLRERATNVSIMIRTGHVEATGPDGSVLVVWAGMEHSCNSMSRGTASLRTESDRPDAAVFTWQGDYRATGWLERYSAIDTRG
jgi:helicase